MQNNDYLINYYNEYDEDGRLESNRIGKVEYLTTRRYIDPLLNWYNIILTFLKASLTAARISKHISAMRLT